ncbi:MAG: dipicolinate synthase subunit B [Clostridiales bacterium]|nr:dipicolinate synthase subunit B [Clostridiales bacterium]
MELRDKSIGYCFTGSFCTLKESLCCLTELVRDGARVTPIFSYAVSSLDTRFFKAEDFRERVMDICKAEPIDTIPEAEPIGPKKLLDLLIIAPCTGNTASKLANGITDTPVLMAAKAHLRNSRPVLLAVASNDALSGSAGAIARLINTKNIYLTPMYQDSPQGKPTSLVADFSLVNEAARAALDSKQLRPVYLV